MRFLFNAILLKKKYFFKVFGFPISISLIPTQESNGSFAFRGRPKFSAWSKKGKPEALKEKSLDGKS